VADAKAQLQAWTEQGEVAVVASAVEGGQAFELVVPAGAKALGVGTGQWQWRELKLKPYVRDAVVDAASAQLQTDPVGAAKRLKTELPSLQGQQRARIISLLGRAAMQAGDYVEAKRLLTESAGVLKTEGYTSRWVQDLLALAFLLNSRLGAFVETLRLLQDCEAGLADAPWLRAEHAYQLGLVHSSTGNIRGALTAFRQAKLWSLRLANEGVLLATQQWIAMTLLALGRGDEALAIEVELVAKHSTEPDPCDLGPVFATAGWISMQSAPIDFERTQHWLDQASTALAECKDVFRTRNAKLNEVSFAISRREYSTAKSRLGSLSDTASGQTTQSAILEKELLGRLEFANGNASAAVVAFDEALRLSAVSGYVDDEIRMKVAKGTALLRSNRAKSAIPLFEEAESKLDQRLLFVPLGEGRTRFLAAREEGAQGLVAAYLSLKNRKAAFQSARRARSRALQTAMLGERAGQLNAEQQQQWLQSLAEFSALRSQLELASAQDWHLSQAELNAALTQRHSMRELAQAKLDQAFSVLTDSAVKKSWAPSPPAQGELLLLYVQRRGSDAQASRGQWDAFAASSSTVEHAVVDAVENNANATHPWLLPFTKLIESASQIRVLFTNNLSEEVHSFSFKGYPLVKHAPVVYALDVPAANTAEGRPLIVSNAQGDLPQSAEEGRELEVALKSRAPKLLEGGSADRQSLLALLPTTGWFHYAGHAVFEGTEGLDSGLPLANGSRLSAADVLSLSAAPALVVLSACEAGRSAGNSNTAGMGLAQSFVLAGSKAVLAPTRPVDDGFSRQLMDLVYQQLLSGLPVQRALQVAQLDPKVQQVDGWSAFRVLVP
jgi:tetratricopeptide (TPR) repeat protein